VAVSNYIFWFLAAFAVFCGLGLLFVKTTPEETAKVSKVLPLVTLYQHKWFRYLAVIFSFLIAVIAFAAME